MTLPGKILFLLLTAALLASAGCEFFETDQERRGVNPKPFNGPSSWETTGSSGNTPYR